MHIKIYAHKFKETATYVYIQNCKCNVLRVQIIHKVCSCE